MTTLNCKTLGKLWIWLISEKNEQIVKKIQFPCPVRNEILKIQIRLILGIIILKKLNYLKSVGINVRICCISTIIKKIEKSQKYQNFILIISVLFA